MDASGIGAHWLRLFAACALALTVAAIGEARGTNMTTGRVFGRIELLAEVDKAVPPGQCVAPIAFSASHYAEVRHRWIIGFLKRFRADLSRKDVPVGSMTYGSGWQTRFNCTAFTDLFLGNASAELMVDLWHARSEAERPAIIAIWYTPDRAPVDARGQRLQHSVVLVVTESGPVFVDPQAGEVILSPRELSTISHRRA
ncbi:MAG: hypothetical protein Q8J74_07710 [Candidatus Didemnitutus sp.]|nr:hypothetical protein [Candidatus Didemnitutus sp.]